MASLGRGRGRPKRIGSLDGLTTGARIEKLRKDRGMTVTQLAAAAGVGSGAIDQLEKEGSNEPSYLNGLRIAFALGVTPWQLAGEPEPTMAEAPSGPAWVNGASVAKRLELSGVETELRSLREIVLAIQATAKDQEERLAAIERQAKREQSVSLSAPVRQAEAKPSSRRKDAG